MDNLPRSELIIITLTTGTRTFTYATNNPRWRDEACKHPETRLNTHVSMFHWRKVGYENGINGTPSGWALHDHQEFNVGRS